MIPFTTGGVNDAVGRPWADKMKGLLGTVVVENIGGAGGGLGAAVVARARPDGYTILLGGMGSQVIVGVATNRANYDPIADFTPIALLGVTALTIAVHPSVPAQTLTELIAYAKANPGKLSFGSSGAGAMNSSDRRAVQVARRPARHRAYPLSRRRPADLGPHQRTHPDDRAERHRQHDGAA